MRALAVLSLWLLLGVPQLEAAPDAVLVVAAEPADAPWWRRAQWRPRATQVYGVPVKRLHPQWCAAEALTSERLEPLVGAAVLETALAGRHLRIDGMFDGSAALQSAFVGAYRRCDGERGLFAAIVEPAKDRMRMRFLVEAPEPGSGLAMLDREPDGTLAVWWCADCANGNRIAYNRDKREYFIAGPAGRR
jgi:hypothetical protein